MKSRKSTSNGRWALLVGTLASKPPQERSTLVRSNGAYAIDLTGLQAPFVLKAEVTTGEGCLELYVIPGDVRRARHSPTRPGALANRTEPSLARSRLLLPLAALEEAPC